MKRCILFSFLGFLLSSVGLSQNTWTQRASIPGTFPFGVERRGAFAFAMGIKGYVGGGQNGSTGTLQDLWEWDQSTNSWTQKANYGGGFRKNAAAFSINDSKGYVGTGSDQNDVLKNDFWEYNPVTNTWTAKTNFPGTSRVGAMGFSIGNKGYIGTGSDGSGLKQDFYEWNPTTNTWASKANFPNARTVGACFVLNGKAYAGLGAITSGQTNTFYEYNPISNAWSAKASYPGSARASCIGFGICDRGYIGTGSSSGGGGTPPTYSEFYEYNPYNNTWIQRANFPTTRVSASSFIIGNKAYITCGQDIIATNIFANDLWEYNPLESISTLTITPTSFCPGNTVDVPFSACGIYNAGNVFTAQLSDANGNFTSPVNIGTLSSTVSGIITATIPINIPTGTGYRIRVISSNPSIIGSDNGINLSTSSQGIWVRKNDLPAPNLPYSFNADQSISFSIGNKGYVCTGSMGPYFWEWDEVTNSWTQKANVGGFVANNIYNAVGFSIGSKGYLGTGDDGSFRNDFWEWDQTSNTWVQKANFAGGGRSGAVGFSIGNKGYIGTGYDGTSYKNDLWEWDQASDTWIQKANLGGSARKEAVGLSIGNKGYIGTGYDGTSNLNDFWEWDQTSNTWTQKSNFGGIARQYAIGFSIGAKAYIGLGNSAGSNDLWEWNSITNSWAQKINFPGPPLTQSTCFVIGQSGYVCGGTFHINGNRVPSRQLWEYNPNICSDVSVQLASTSICAGNNLSIPYSAHGSFASGNTFTAQLSDASGNFNSPTNIGSVTSTSSGTINSVIPSSTLSGSNYRLRVISSNPAVQGTNNGNDISISTGCGTLIYNGTSSKTVVPNNNAYNFGTGNFTLEAWIKADPTSSGDKPIISNRGTNWPGTFLFMINQGTRLWLQANGVNMASSYFTNIYDGQCHHVAVTRSGSTITFYLDGIAQGTTTNTSNLSSTYPIHFGHDAHTFLYFKGEIDDVRIWNIARSQTNLSNNMNKVIPGNASGLKGYWTMSEQSGQVIYDASPIQNNGSLGNNPTVADSDDPVRSSGGCFVPENNPGVSFTSTGQRITIPHNSSYDIGSGDFTIEAWVNLSAGSSGRSILSKRTGPTNGFLFIPYSSGTRLLIQLNGVPNYLSSSFPSITDNNCHHVAVTRSNDTISFFVDGIARGTVVTSRGMNSTGPLYIGYDIYDNISAIGNINETRLWNIARSQSELNAYKNQVLPENTANLIGYWKLNESSGQAISDASSILNHGYLGTNVNQFDSQDPIRTTTACYSGDLKKGFIFDDYENADSVNVLAKKQVHLFPNPYSEELNLIVGNESGEEGKFKVLDINGKLLHEDNFIPNTTQTIKLDIAEGIYIIEIYQEGYIQRHKVIKLD